MVKVGCEGCSGCAILDDQPDTVVGCMGVDDQLVFMGGVGCIGVACMGGNEDMPLAVVLLEGLGALGKVEEVGLSVANALRL